jgi:hypothetical protein
VSGLVRNRGDQFLVVQQVDQGSGDQDLVASPAEGSDLVRVHNSDVQWSREAVRQRQARERLFGPSLARSGKGTAVLVQPDSTCPEVVDAQPANGARTRNNRHSPYLEWAAITPGQTQLWCQRQER